MNLSQNGRIKNTSPSKITHHLPQSQLQLTSTSNSSSSSSSISIHQFINTLLIFFLGILFYLERKEIYVNHINYTSSIHSIQDQVTYIEEEIKYLSDNTTTKEILSKIKSLQQNLYDLEQSTNVKLENTQNIVNQRLDIAVIDLDKAVNEAEKKINDQVTEVRDDMAIYISVTNQQLSAESDFIKYEIAGTFTLLACLISMWHVWGHARHFAKPSVQRRILAILAMVPIYSITSWLSLVFPSTEVTLSTIRDCYEAYIIYTFMALLIAILGEERGLNAAVNILAEHLIEEEEIRLRHLQDAERLESTELMNNSNHSSESEIDEDEESGLRDSLLHHSELSSSSNSSLLHHIRPITSSSSPSSSRILNSTRSSSLSSSSSSQPTILSSQSIQPPFYCFIDETTKLNPRSHAASVLDQCQSLAMQFVLLKPLLAIIPFILELSGVNYNSHNIVTADHQIDWTSPKLYVYILLNISVAFAFYGLMIFYTATEKLLAWCDPWPKFLCIKGIVFMTFWQGIAITGMSLAGIVDEKSALAAQNMLICIEMLLASIMHHLFFPYQEWQKGYKKDKERQLMNVKDLLAFRDFIGDVKGIIYRRAWEGVPHGNNVNNPQLDHNHEINQPQENNYNYNYDDHNHNHNHEINDNSNHNIINNNNISSSSINISNRGSRYNKNEITDSNENDRRSRSPNSWNTGQNYNSSSLKGYNNSPSSIKRHSTSTSEVELIESVIDDILDDHTSSDRRKQG